MQFLANGISSSAAIALLAVAFQFVYLPTRVFFLGLAGIYALAPFVSYSILRHGGGLGLAVTGAIVVSAVLSLLCDWTCHGPLSREKASDGIQLLTSLGIYIVIVQTISIFWGSDWKHLRADTNDVFQWGGAHITSAQAAKLIAAVILIGTCAAVIRFSGFGVRVRALADSPTQFALWGYNVRRYRMAAYALAGSLASMSALVTAYDYGFEPQAGLPALLLAIIAAIIGGKTLVAGPVAGALILGMLRIGVEWQWSARWQEPITFAVLAIFLVLRPQGLLSRRNRLESTP